MNRLFLALMLAGCGDEEKTGSPTGTADTGTGDTVVTDDTGEPPRSTDPVAVDVDDVCEPLSEGACMLPWPSDRYLDRAQGSETGFAIAYEQDAAWANTSGVKVDVSTFSRLDGFSPSSQILTLFDEPVDTDGTAFWDSIELSMEEDHPTVLLDLETGERVPHWVEADARATDPDETIFFIRPTVRLEANRRYGVAIRGLSGVSGEPLSSSAAFIAMRDDRPLDPPMPSLETRRSGFETLFDALEEAGIARDSLQQAWWFHTASDPSTRATLKTMRSDAMAQLGEDGLGCTVTSAEDTAVGGRLIQATVTVPWYMDAPNPPAEIVRDSAGEPVLQGTEEVEFAAYIPNVVLQNLEPKELLLWGHGLFGSGPPIVENLDVQLMGETLAAPMAATDWHGMSTKDLVFLVSALADVSKFYQLGESLQQGMVVKNALTRSLMGICGDDPAFQRDDGGPAISRNDPRFVGISQGSVLGGAFLTQSPDIERGALLVGGATFSFMIERSIHFNTYETFLMPAYEKRLVTAQLMAFSQHVWDYAESAAYIAEAEAGLWDAGPKRYIYLVAHNDSQVPNLSSDIAVRMTGMPVLEDSSYVPWGAETITGPTTESAFISFHMGDRENPRGNESPDSDDGGHNSAPGSGEALDMIHDFFETGSIESPCGGPCIFF